MILAVILTLNIVTVQISADETSSNESAEILSMVGMFKGSDKGFELDREPSRLEGLVMMLRVIGKEEEALSYDTEVKTFNDVPGWGMKYVQFAYDHGLTKGITDSEFGSDITIDSKSYLTFILRALGYDDNESDFDWATAEDIETMRNYSFKINNILFELFAKYSSCSYQSFPNFLISGSFRNLYANMLCFSPNKTADLQISQTS